MADLFRNAKVLPELVVLGACDSEECGQALVKAGVPHVVAIRSSHNVSGTKNMRHYPAFPVMFVGLYETSDINKLSSKE